MFPLSSTLDLSTVATLALAVVLGLGFGFILERAGFGSARKLTAVFYFYDMAVVKVMFTASTASTRNNTTSSARPRISWTGSPGTSLFLNTRISTRKARTVLVKFFPG